MSQTVKDTLVRGKEQILARGWCQGESIASDGSCCILGALMLAEPDVDERYGAIRAIRRVLGSHDLSVANYNDAPERTKDEVLAAFDKAIASEGGAP